MQDTDKTIIGNVRANDISMSDKTLEIYLRALRRLYVNVSSMNSEQCKLCVNRS